MLVKLLRDHFDKDCRYVYAGTVVDMPLKDLSTDMLPSDATATSEMGKRFKLVNGYYVRT